MTQFKNNNQIDNNGAGNLQNPFTQAKKTNHNMSALNLRWQEIRKWELNRLRIQEFNHSLAFKHAKSIQQEQNAISVCAKNDNTY